MVRIHEVEDRILGEGPDVHLGDGGFVPVGDIDGEDDVLAVLLGGGLDVQKHAVRGAHCLLFPPEFDGGLELLDPEEEGIDLLLEAFHFHDGFIDLLFIILTREVVENDVPGGILEFEDEIDLLGFEVLDHPVQS